MTIMRTLAALVVASALTHAAAAADNNLPEDHAAFAARTLEFIAKMDKLYYDAVERLNGDLDGEEKVFDNEYGTYNAKVARGPVVEKAGRVVTVTKKPTADFQRQSSWSRFMALDTHPASPLTGTLHAAFVVQFYPDGSSTIGGWLDVMPGAMKSEDTEELKRVMDGIYAAHGADAAKHRELVCRGVEEEVNPYRRKPACVGGSFYGRDMLSVSEENFRFVTEAYEAFVTTYLDLIERRKDGAFTDEDVRAQEAMRRNWFEDRMFADPFTTNVTPYEAWALYSLPPVVKF